MSARIANHIRSNIYGLIAVFIALSATASAADGPLPGQNTVGSADIINDEVSSSDVRNDALSGGGLTAPDLRAEAVRSSEVLDNSLRGADIDEATLNGVAPAGAAGGELAGTYPSPTIGTVTGLDLATSSPAAPGIRVGPGGPKIYNLAGFPGTLNIEATQGINMLGSTNLAGPAGVNGVATLNDEVRLPNATAASDGLVFGNSSSANLYRSAGDTLHTDDSLEADGNLVADGNATLGSDRTDTIDLNGGPVNFPNADNADDALILDGLVNLYRNAGGRLRTDDRFSAQAAELDDYLQLDTNPDFASVPPTDGVYMFVGCALGVPTIMFRWPDGEVDLGNSDNPESPGNGC